MDFIRYLSELPPVKLDRLYESHFTCQAVLRSLPPIAKQYVLRLLFIEQPIAGETMRGWAKPEALGKHNAAMERLDQLRVLLETGGKSGKKDASYRLNPVFQQQLQRALSGAIGPPKDPLPPALASHKPSPADLNAYALKQWESLLLFLANAGAPGGERRGDQEPSKMIKGLLRRAGLMGTSDEGGVRISDEGFRFLLMDLYKQLWVVVREYVAEIEDQGLDGAQVTCFLMELGFYPLGEPHGVNRLSSLQKRVVEDLASVGLVYIQKAGGQSCFYPTRLASNLSASLSESSTWQPAEGFIIVETNFRTYGYTTSPLQIAILRLFTRIEYVLPNLVVGTITRESVNTAFSNGITADQIVAYLQQHAAPQIRQRVPVVPETVADQVRLWERDRNRVQQSRAVLYEEFPSQERFAAVVDYARQVGALLWQNPIERRFVASDGRHDDIRAFIRNQSRT
ncbi:putative Transcription factor Tfb2 [Klebsormidium nitens]|uniref:RNA polymerase II transcription factor B subunit 2 n=1 Tax=Klebsormidium nitens TaxID=105231 RepID=A0A1Y1I418_KLENI|nr:putative Transcription factor Tfb2 [Klebsormidium nitens]|eukprot:GAQ85685.1 putative Transcription factor Tfb2 [Klebsormidium nitens]